MSSELFSLPHKVFKVRLPHNQNADQMLGWLDEVVGREQVFCEFLKSEKPTWTKLDSVSSTAFYFVDSKQAALFKLTWA